eukprot:GHVL01038707.1.p1 GENE.GHVL01038707.1~~GHVL01038707.1.p1  ORF type:complete len:356 (-),score=48.98 GHVL01038707.1:144-1211(-)
MSQKCVILWLVICQVRSFCSPTQEANHFNKKSIREGVKLNICSYWSKKCNDLWSMFVARGKLKEEVADWKLVTLGTCSIPLPTYGSSAAALQLPKGDVWLFDAGFGTKQKLVQAAVRLSRIQKIFISHMHPDHVGGVVEVMISAIGARNRNTKNDVLEIYGPHGIREFIRSQLRAMVLKFYHKWTVHEIHGLSFKEDEGGLQGFLYSRPLANTGEISGKNILVNNLGCCELVTSEEATVSCAQLNHTIPTAGFVIEERLPDFLVNSTAVMELLNGCKDPEVFKKVSAMKFNEKLVFPNNREVLFDEVMIRTTNVRLPRKICIIQDSCDATKAVDLAVNSTIVLHECTNGYISKSG